MHETMAVFAATGAFLSFFHQGSLGGVAGVLFGRPFAFREGLLIWPWTFFLFTWSAGPMALFYPADHLDHGKSDRKKLVKDNVIELLAKISGWMIFTYTIAKICDTTRWANITAPGLGQTLADFYTGNAFYGYWILFAEIILGGVVPAIILISRPLRKNPTWRVTAFILGVMGVSLNRWYGAPGYGRADYAF